MTDTQGMVIEGYRIEGVLGKGAMGIVYKGWDEDLQQHVAIKMIHDHLATMGLVNHPWAKRALGP